MLSLHSPSLMPGGTPYAASEAEVAGLLRDTERAHPLCQIGSYPFFKDGRVGSNFVIRSTDAQALAACAHALGSGLDAAGFAWTAGGIAPR